jgi:hypothetical protein
MQQLEMLVFFSGYPLVYLLVRFFIRRTPLKNARTRALMSNLPFAYALSGTLYLSLQLKNLYPVYTIENIRHRIQQPYLFAWALMSLLFWIPAIPKKETLSVLHSLVFFLIIVRDLYLELSGSIPDRDILRNDMTLYTISILMNLAAFMLVSLPCYIYSVRKSKQGR